MPIYEYICEDCGARYEQIVMSRGQKISCPKCSSSSHTLQLSVFSTNSRSNSSASESSSPGGCASTPNTCGCN